MMKKSCYSDIVNYCEPTKFKDFDEGGKCNAYSEIE